MSASGCLSVLLALSLALACLPAGAKSKKAAQTQAAKTDESAPSQTRPDPTLVSAPASAVERNWQEQESWQQFRDKEHYGGFKLNPGSRQPAQLPPPGRSQSAWLEPLGQPVPSQLPSQSSWGNFAAPRWAQPTYEPGSPWVDPVPGYDSPLGQSTSRPPVLLMPPAAAGAADRSPSVRLSRPYFSFSGPNQAFRRAWGPYYPYGPGTASPSWGSWQNFMNMNNNWRYHQSTPSPASGNYYGSPVVDPFAAGNYYGPSGPQALPLVGGSDQTRSAKDYWGRQGSPLPEDFRPQEPD